jgi:SGNH domain (fused to AT3 domains)
VARFRPDVVVWVSSWETSARIVAGRLSHFGTIDGNHDLIQRIDEVVGWLTSTGARVVFVPLAPSAQPSAHGVPSPANDARIVELANVLRTYARQHSSATSVVDLPALICPQEPACPAEVDGVVPRPADGIHFEGRGATWVADHVLPLVLEPASPSPPPSGANAALTPRA